ncbi:MAG: hypothetical protein KKH98_06750 [Spirochaetes bacterium]|nr:hypothetical protein [Spirochaetota bacterium]
MYKKLIIPVIFVLLAFSIGCSKSGKYNDMKILFSKVMEAQESFISDLENTMKADDAADAINALADKMEKLIPEMKKMEMKYPELKDKKEPPTELKESIEKLGMIGAKMSRVSAQKLSIYVNEPEVQKATIRLAQTMQ